MSQRLSEEVVRILLEGASESNEDVTLISSLPQQHLRQFVVSSPRRLLTLHYTHHLRQLNTMLRSTRHSPGQGQKVAADRDDMLT